MTRTRKTKGQRYMDNQKKKAARVPIGFMTENGKAHPVYLPKSGKPGRLKQRGGKIITIRETLPFFVRKRLPASKSEAKQFGTNLVPGVYHLRRRKQRNQMERISLGVPAEKSKFESAGERYSRKLREQAQARS